MYAALRMDVALRMFRSCAATYYTVFQVRNALVRRHLPTKQQNAVDKTRTGSTRYVYTRRRDRITLRLADATAHVYLAPTSLLRPA